MNNSKQAFMRDWQEELEELCCQSNVLIEDDEDDWQLFFDVDPDPYDELDFDPFYSSWGWEDDYPCSIGAYDE